MEVFKFGGNVTNKLILEVLQSLIDSQEVDKIIQTINNDAKKNFDTLRDEIVEKRTRMEKWNTTVTEYFDELYIKVDGTNDKADQIKTAINATSEKVDIWIALNSTVLSRIERKIDRIGRLSMPNWHTLLFWGLKF